MKPSIADVVIVNDFAYVNGGSSQVALSSGAALARSGVRVTMFSAVGPAMPELENTVNLRVVLTGQHEIVNDPSRLRAATQGIWNVAAARALTETLRELDPKRTIVHFHGWTKALSSSVVRAAIDSGFPAVITLHEYFTACPIGSFYNHRREGICKLEPMSRSCIMENCDSRSYADKAWRVARQAVQRSAGRIPDGVRDFITISDMSAAILTRHLPATARMHRVNNPIDAERRPRAKVESNDAFTYVGRLSPEKGALLFARAAQAAGVRAVFVGDGECVDDIRRSNPSVEITGWLPRAAVAERLAGARALVFPSLWYENSPLVISEAAALGVPAIVADTSAGRERVADGLTGRYFRGGDGLSLTAALKLLKSGPLSAALGASAYREYWESPQHMARHLADLTHVYETILRDGS
jgi:glycosyltransferase involved in cell wall biosynthesis